MSTPAEYPEVLRELFPEAGPELLRLLAGAADNANLLRTDFYTIRDLVELSEYRAADSLHALLLAMLLALDEGSLCVEVTEAALARRFADLVSAPEALSWAQRILDALKDPGFPNLIGEDVGDGKPVVRHCAGQRLYLYFQKYLKHEQLLQRELCKRLTDSSCQAITHALPAILHEVFTSLPPDSASKPMHLNRDQRLAVGLALLRNFVIISGGPGTGKTSIVTALLRCLVRAGFAPDRIVLIAPTGRAAQRMTDAVRAGCASLGDIPADGPDGALKDLAAKTVHQLLGFNPAHGSFRHHVENPIPADVIIVDEVSMVGLVLMAKLLQAARPEAKLILLGDKDQLPSVDAGAVLAQLVPSGSQAGYSAPVCARLRELLHDGAWQPATCAAPLQDALVILHENFRSQKAIHATAQGVNSQQLDVAEQLRLLKPAGGRQGDTLPEENLFAQTERESACWLLPQAHAGVAEWKHILTHWAEHQFLSPAAGAEPYSVLVARCGLITPQQPEGVERGHLEKLFRLLARSRILTLVREGPWGCEGINRFLHRELRPRLDADGGGRFFAGMPVLVTRNDYSRLLFNGDVGIALKSAGGGYRVVFQRPDAFLSYPAEALPGHEPAFALTVHKSQGTEYDQALLVLPPEGGKRLLTKEIIYTGITRAKQTAIIAGKKEILCAAIARKIERQSALLGTPCDGEPI